MHSGFFPSIILVILFWTLDQNKTVNLEIFSDYFPPTNALLFVAIYFHLLYFLKVGLEDTNSQLA